MFSKQQIKLKGKVEVNWVFDNSKNNNLEYLIIAGKSKIIQLGELS